MQERDSLVVGGRFTALTYVKWRRDHSVEAKPRRRLIHLMSDWLFIKHWYLAEYRVDGNGFPVMAELTPLSAMSARIGSV